MPINVCIIYHIASMRGAWCQTSHVYAGIQLYRIYRFILRQAIRQIRTRNNQTIYQQP